MTIKNRIKSKEYREGVNSFIEFAKANVGLEDDIWCPCVDCMNDKKRTTNDVKIHLILKGISPSYKTWVLHGEYVPAHEPCESNEDARPHSKSSRDGVEGHNLEDIDELPNMLEEVYRGMFVNGDDDLADSMERENVGNFDKLFDDAQQPLFPGCKSFTVLSFVVKMLHIKVHNKWSNNSFNMNMKVFKELLTEWNETVPWTIYEAKKFLRDLGLGYEAIHACKNDCALFWKENENLEKCPKCGEPRYKLNKGKGTKILQKFQHRGIWDVPEIEVSELDDGEDTYVLNHAFQQDETNGVVPISGEDPTAVPLRRLDIDAEIIPPEVVLQSRGQEQDGGSDDDGFIYDDEDESFDEQSDEEEEDISTDSDSDIDPDIEP
ncbi:hypothetical protein Vadar_000966 [Vaccinium darrowii]|uniref:Uncharacterized protein n=1 Tax=Vaccinium darrowii TaxID=229202 RepID=A0ACB7YJH4_9ERIC|nr:hypothetical protein Vadar_000966 [Vaccinium darrowii]